MSILYPFEDKPRARAFQNVEVRFAFIGMIEGVECVLDGVTKYSNSSGIASFLGISQGAHTYSVSKTGMILISGEDPFGRPLSSSGTTVIEWVPVPGVPWPDTQPWLMQFTFEEIPQEPSINITSAEFPDGLDAGDIPAVALFYDVIAPVGQIQLLVRIYDIATGALVCETGTMYHTSGSYEWNIPPESWSTSMPAETWNLRIEIVRWWP